MKCMATAACAAITFASAWADAGFSAGRWNIAFFDDGERLVMSHADGFAEIAGTLSFTGPAKVTGAGIGADAKAVEESGGAVAAVGICIPESGDAELCLKFGGRDSIQ